MLFFFLCVPCKWGRADADPFILGYEDKFFISALKNTRCCGLNSKEATRIKPVILDAEFVCIRTNSRRHSDSSSIYLLTFFLKAIKIYRIKLAQAFLVPQYFKNPFQSTCLCKESRRLTGGAYLHLVPARGWHWGRAFSGSQALRGTPQGVRRLWEQGTEPNTSKASSMVMLSI